MGVELASWVVLGVETKSLEFGWNCALKQRMVLVLPTYLPVHACRDS
jgi:hypothetical protein